MSKIEASKMRFCEWGSEELQKMQKTIGGNVIHENTLSIVIRSLESKL